MVETYKMQHLLDNVGYLSKRYDDEAKSTGENFNIFSIMKMEWNEVYTHSAIIGELLNPDGSHNFGNKFLNAFIEILNNKFNIEIKSFERLVNEKICERTISIYNNWDTVTGGRIDLIIEDNKQIILIENKLNAKDQDYQLIRYYNYAKLRNKEFYIIYLSLDEKNLIDEKEYIIDSDKFTGRNFSYLQKKDYDIYKSKHNNSNNHYCLYYPISFKVEILKWLEECIKISSDISLICETIKQYRNNIKNITNQNSNIQMDNEIKKLITIENVASIQILNSLINEIINDTKKRFYAYFEKKFISTQITLKDNSEITSHYIDDVDGFSIGFQYFQGETESNLSQKGIYISEKIKLKFPDLEIISSRWYLGWYNPKPFNRGNNFEKLNVEVILKMHQDQYYLENIVNNIISQYEELKEYIIKLSE